MTAPGGVSEQQVLAVGRGLLTELARLHEAGRVSGVVGPSTVLVDADGSVRLVEGGAPDQAYASPEVLSGQPPTTRSDLYSAAAVLAHLFRGAATLPPTVADLDPGSRLAARSGPRDRSGGATRIGRGHGGGPRSARRATTRL